MPTEEENKATAEAIAAAVTQPGDNPKPLEELKAETEATAEKLKRQREVLAVETQKKREEDRVAFQKEQERQKLERNQARAEGTLEQMKSWYGNQEEFLRRIGYKLVVTLDGDRPVFEVKIIE